MTLPSRGKVYTVREIMQLDLKDSPFLRVPAPAVYGGELSPIQDDGITEELLAVIGDLKFEYMLTTDEWTPLFNYRGTPEELDAAVEFELNLDPFAEKIAAWVTVKGHYSEQYYSWDEETYEHLRKGIVAAEQAAAVMVANMTPGLYCKNRIEPVWFEYDNPDICRFDGLSHAEGIALDDKQRQMVDE